MFEWIINNKEWLFSGVGVAVVGWLFYRYKSEANITASNRSVAAKNMKGSQINIGDNNETKR